MKKNKKTRFIYLISLLIGFSISGYLICSALSDSFMFFLAPSEIKKISQGQFFRIGGIVKKGSIEKKAENIFFILHDEKSEIKVRYQGILPDLFRAGQGIVAYGYIQENIFLAKELLAKHDENYKPPAKNDQKYS